MSWRRLLAVAYVLLVEGLDSEGVAEVDAELGLRSKDQIDAANELTWITAAGGRVA